MYIGYLADIVFYTAFNNVITPSEYSRTGSGRWEEHSLMHTKPVLQFTGPGLTHLSFKILVSKSLGQSPKSILRRLRDYRDNGAVVPFILGGKPVSQNYFIIESLEENEQYFDAYGKLMSVEISLALREYDDTNKVEEQSLLNSKGTKFNKINSILRWV